VSARWRVRGLTDREFTDWRLTSEVVVHLSGPLGDMDLSPAARDLLRVGAAVHAIERGLPAAPGTNRPVEFQVQLKLEDPDRWSNTALAALGSLLAFQGDAEWRWTMSRGPRVAFPVDISRASRDTREIDRVTLFSAGLDSTSGIAISRRRRDRCWN